MLQGLTTKKYHSLSEKEKYLYLMSNDNEALLTRVATFIQSCLFDYNS